MRKPIQVPKEPTFSLIEDEISFPFKVIGRKAWLDEMLAPGAVESDQVVEIGSPADLDLVKKEFLNYEVHGLDTETGGDNPGDGLDPLCPTSRTLLVQYGTKDFIYIFEPDLLPNLKDLLQSKKHLILGQNILHDFEFILSKYKFALVRMYDTMLAEQLLSAGLAGVRVGLKDLARKYPPNYVTAKTVRDKFINFRRGDKITQDMLYYSARDVYELFPIWKHQTVELRKWNLIEAVQNEFNCIQTTADMELTGIMVDDNILKRAISRFVERKKELEEEAIREYNRLRKEMNIHDKQLTVIPAQEIVEYFDMDSPMQKKNILHLFGKMVLDTKRDTLEQLVDFRLAQIMAEYSECQKVTSTYGQGLLDKKSPWTGKFHPDFFQMGRGDISGGKGGASTIATERYSSDAQQIPRPKKYYMEVTDPEELAFIKKEYTEQLAAAGYKDENVQPTIVAQKETNGST